MVKHRMDLLELLRERGIDGDVDFLLEALRVLVDGIMDAEVSAKIGAQHGERSPERVTYRNGYRNRGGTGALVPRQRQEARASRHQGRPGTGGAESVVHVRMGGHPPRQRNASVL